jgi:hypothetical protein
MRLIQPNYLVPNTTYYIQSYLPAGDHNVGLSHKKMGEFVRLGMRDNVPPVFAHFRNLRDMPNARLPSGMGTAKENSYSTLNTSFFLPENEMILGNATFNTALQGKLDLYTSSNIAKKYFPVGLGTRRKRARKSKRRRRNNKK